MLRVEEVNDVTALEGYRERWRALADRAERVEIFQSYEWLTAWLDCFWQQRPIAFVFVTEGERLLGLAPLLDDAQGAVGCARSLALPVNSHAVRADLLCVGDEAEVAAALLDHLRRTRRQVKVRFKTCLCASPAARAVLEAAPHHRMATMSLEGRCSRLIRLDGDWQGYLESRSRHFRSELRRKRRKLERAGRVRWRVVARADECERALEDVYRIEKRSWKEGAETSITAEPRLERFYHRFALRAADRGWLRLFLLQLDAEPIAYIYGVAYRNEYYAIKTSYDQRYRALSPGVVLFAHALEHACDHGLVAVDLLGVDARWKRELANDLRRYGEICVFSRGLVRCHGCALRAERLKPWVRRRAPRLLAWRRRLRQALARAGHGRGGGGRR